MNDPKACLSLGGAVSHGFNIRMYCLKCAHTRIVDAGPLSALFRLRCWADDFESAKRKLRCRCDTKGPAMHATLDPPDSVPIGPTNGQEYKSMMRRLRG